MKYTLFILFMLLATYAHAQQAATVYDTPEEKAYFAFGQDSLDRFMIRNVHFRHVENGGTGKAVVIFIVEADGHIGNAEIINASGDKDFDKEAVRVVKTMPAWLPAKNKGSTVRSTAMLSVSYRLR